MNLGILMCVFLLAGAYNVQGVTFDYFDIGPLCDPSNVVGDLCDNGYGVCGGQLLKDPWTGECALTCNPGKSCYLLPTIPNGVVYLTSGDDTLGATAIVVCNNGYELNGPMYLTCGANRNWIPSLDDPCQPKQCDLNSVPVLTNGSMITLNNEVGGYAVGVCNDGYSSSGGLITSQCDGYGNWTQIVGECIKESCDPDLLPPNFIPQGNNCIGEMAKLECGMGEKIDGCDFVVCTSNLTWTVAKGQCVPECCTIPCIDNGYIVTENLTGIVYCNQGYELVNNSMQAECNVSTNTWSNLGFCQPLPTTPPINCSATLPNVSHSTSYLASDNLNPGAVVVHTCDLGYRPSDPLITSFCQADGTWMTSYSDCYKIYCNDSTLPSIENGMFVNQGDGSYNTESQLVCSENYRLVGDGIVYCNINGMWDRSDAKCEPECCEIPCIENGKIEAHPTNSTIGVLTCAYGYVFNEMKGLECNLTTGMWNDGDLEDICIEDGAH